ncbi:MAG: phenylacetate--CoA ligase [Alphaproteobacteria bacterium]|nr:phenylacetate--CoA ligase [Alphaproteobacteria bacterium]
MTELLRQPITEIQRVQSENLARQVVLCARGHKYYQERWKKAGIDPASIRSLQDLERLPLTPKSDLMADPEAFRLRIPDLPLHERALWEVNYTTGSTSEPTPLYVTTHDYQAYLFQARRVAEISGITENDVLANLFPVTHTAMGAFSRSAANAYASGASVVGALTGAPFGDFDIHRSLDYAVRMVERHRATVLWGITSFVRRTILRAVDLGADFTSVRMCGVTGEASSPAMREDMRQRLRDLGSKNPRIFDRYGTTEAGGLAQCAEDGDWHNPAPEVIFNEVVDPDTGRRLPDGARGALAITHLNRRGTTLMRYLVGDIVSLAHQACPHCGRIGDRVQAPIVRTKDLLKVKGMLVNPAALLEAVRAVPGVDEYQVVLARQDPKDPFSMDEMIVRVASPRTDREALAQAVMEAAQSAVRVRPRVEFAAASDIYDPRQTKATRLVDRR